VYFLTSEECYCLAAKDGKPEPGTPPALPKNEPAPQGAKVATVQVFPADITVHPGEAIDFTVKTFDDKGRLIGTAKGAWSLAGQLPRVVPGQPPAQPMPGQPAPAAPPPLAGELSAKEGESTKVTIAKAPANQFGRVVAKVDGVEGYSRVRVAAALPFNADFSK